MNLFKYKAILLIIFLGSISPIHAQSLSEEILGRWEVKKFQKDKKPELQGGTVEFLSSGTMLSEGVFFGNTKNTFTTDAKASTLFIHNEEGTTEWLASVKNDVLRLKSKRKSSSTNEKVYITFMRIKG